MEPAELNCGEIRKLINAYVDHELSPEQDRAVLVHLKECQICHNLVLEEVRIKQAVKQVGQKMKAPEHLKQRIRRKLGDLINDAIA